MWMIDMFKCLKRSTVLKLTIVCIIFIWMVLDEISYDNFLGAFVCAYLKCPIKIWVDFKIMISLTYFLWVEFITPSPYRNMPNKMLCLTAEAFETNG